MFAVLGKASLHIYTETSLTRYYDISYVKITLLRRKDYVTYVISTLVPYVIFTLAKLRKKVFPF